MTSRNATGGLQGTMWVVGLFCMLSSLVIDGFPAGIIVLREFGARPTNFLILIAFAVLLWQEVSSVEPLKISVLQIFFLLLCILGIPAINLPVALLLQSDSPTGSLILDWSKQYAMLIWGLLSYWTWRKILAQFSVDKVGSITCVSAMIPLAAFYTELIGPDWVQDALNLVRLKTDSRPSGLATEPSLFAAWLAYVWPIVFFHALRAKSLSSKTFGFAVFLAICLGAFLSHARTIAVVVVLQIIAYGYWSHRRSSGLGRVRSFVIFAVLVTVIAGVFAASLTSLTNVDLGSNISRVGSTVTAIRVSIAHPIFGIGIGQLTYFFGAYAPDFALVSEEISSYSDGLSSFRASSFNLFVRLICEFGFIAGSLFCLLVLKPIISAVRSNFSDQQFLFLILSAIGGVGFWLSQDQYGYQPAILTLAALSNAISARMSDPNCIRPDSRKPLNGTTEASNG